MLWLAHLGKSGGQFSAHGFGLVAVAVGCNGFFAGVVVPVFEAAGFDFVSPAVPGFFDVVVLEVWRLEVDLGDLLERLRTRVAGAR